MSQEKTTPTKTVVVPDDLHTQLKLFCVASGRTILEVVVTAIREFLDRQSK